VIETVWRSSSARSPDALERERERRTEVKRESGGGREKGTP